MKLRIALLSVLLLLVLVMVIPMHHSYALPEPQGNVTLRLQEGDEPDIPVDPDTMAKLLDTLSELNQQLGGGVIFDNSTAWIQASLALLLVSGLTIKGWTSMVKVALEKSGFMDRASKGLARYVVLWTIALGTGVVWVFAGNNVNIFASAPFEALRTWNETTQITVTGLLSGGASIMSHEVISAVLSWLTAVGEARK